MYGAQSNKRDFESAMGSFSDHNNSVQKPPMNYYQGMMPSSAPMGGYFYSPQAMNGYPVNQQSMGPQVDTPGGQSVLGHPAGMARLSADGSFPHSEKPVVSSTDSVGPMGMTKPPSMQFRAQTPVQEQVLMPPMGVPGFDPRSMQYIPPHYFQNSAEPNSMVNPSGALSEAQKADASAAEMALEKRRARNRATAAESRRKFKEEVQNLRDELKRMKEDKIEKEALIEYYRNRYERFEKNENQKDKVGSLDQAADEAASTLINLHSDGPRKVPECKTDSEDKDERDRDNSEKSQAESEELTESDTYESGSLDDTHSEEH